jgi:hypothetical protein
MISDAAYLRTSRYYERGTDSPSFPPPHDASAKPSARSQEDGWCWESPTEIMLTRRVPPRMCIRGNLQRFESVRSACKGVPRRGYEEGRGGAYPTPCFLVLNADLRTPQTFNQVAVTWKCLEHLNIVPFLGVTTDPLELISDQMPGGDLPGYIANHPDANRILIDQHGRACLADFGLSEGLDARRMIA